MKGIVIVPSRNRPESIAELLDSFIETGAIGRVALIVAVDADDEQLPGYEAVAEFFRVDLRVGEPARMGPVLNREAVLAAPSYDWVGFMGDDHRPRTPGWPDLVDEALAVGPGVVYGDDLLQGEDLATAVFQSSALIQRLGYYHPPALRHLFLDNYWMVLGRATRLVYLPEMVIEHMHPFAGKAVEDIGYRLNNNRSTNLHDQREFERYMAEDWPAARLALAEVVVS